MPKGEPYGGPLTNWVTQEYKTSVQSTDYVITMAHAGIMNRGWNVVTSIHSVPYHVRFQQVDDPYRVDVVVPPGETRTGTMRRVDYWVSQWPEGGPESPPVLWRAPIDGDFPPMRCGGD